MKRTAAIALLLIAAATFAAAQEKTTVYRLEYTVVEMDGAKKVSSRVYTVLVEDHKKSSLRVGTRVPIRTGGSADSFQFQYHDIGVNLDASPAMIDGTTIRLETTIDVSSVVGTENASMNRPPVTRNCRDQLTSVIPLDKSVTLTTQDDPGGTTSMQVQVIARIVK